SGCVRYWYSLATLGRWCRLRSYLNTAAAHSITALDAVAGAVRRSGRRDPGRGLRPHSYEGVCVMWGMPGVVSVATFQMYEREPLYTSILHLRRALLSPAVDTSGKKNQGKVLKMESVVNDYISREIIQDPALLPLSNETSLLEG